MKKAIAASIFATFVMSVWAATKVNWSGGASAEYKSGFRQGDFEYYMTRTETCTEATVTFDDMYTYGYPFSINGMAVTFTGNEASCGWTHNNGNRTFAIGGDSGSAASFTITAGSFVFNNNNIVLGNTNAKGSMTVTGGTVTMGCELRVGNTTAGTEGEFTLEGGVVNAGNYVCVGYSQGGGTMTIKGGDFKMTNDNRKFIVGQGANTEAKGIFNMEGGTLTVNQLWVAENETPGEVNLKGGVLTAMSVKTGTKGGKGVINFNGGTLKAGYSNPNMFSLDDDLTLNLESGGLVFDTAGYDVTISNTLYKTGPVKKRGLGTLTLAANLDLTRTFDFDIDGGVGPVALTGAANTLTSGNKIAVTVIPTDVISGKTYILMSGLGAFTASDIVLTGSNADYSYTPSVDGGTLTVKISFADTKSVNANYELTGDEDWSAKSVTIDENVTIDLKGHNLVIGNYEAGTGVKFTNTDSTLSTLTLGANNGAMTGNANAQFDGNLCVKVTGEDDTGFSPALSNTHTGGWIFENNNYNIQIKYHTSQMGTGKIVFNGNGGFTPYYDSETKDGWEESSVTRDVEVNGSGNVIIATMNADSCLLLKRVNLTGSGELAIKRSSSANVAMDLFTSGSQASFAGKIIVDNTDIYWGTSYDCSEATFEFKGSKTLYMTSSASPATSVNYKMGDLVSEDSSVKISGSNYSRPGMTLYVGYNNTPHSYFAGYFAHVNSKQYNLAKVGTGTWTIGGNISLVNASLKVQEGVLNVMGVVHENTSVTVESAGTLGGTGTIKGSLAADGTIAPGTNTTGTLTVAGTTTFNSGAKLRANLGAAGASSCLALTGASDVDISNLTVEIPDASALASKSGYSYSLLTAQNGSLTGTAKLLGGTVTAPDGSCWKLVVNEGKSLCLEQYSKGFVITIAGANKAFGDDALSTWLEEQSYDLDTAEGMSAAQTALTTKNSNNISGIEAYLLGYNACSNDAKAPTIATPVTTETGWTLAYDIGETLPKVDGIQLQYYVRSSNSIAFDDEGDFVSDKSGDNSILLPFDSAKLYAKVYADIVAE